MKKIPLPGFTYKNIRLWSVSIVSPSFASLLDSLFRKIALKRTVPEVIPV